MKFENKVKIGLEIHGYLLTKEKLFCKCPSDYKTAKPNINVCPICTAQPGSKPMLPNEEAIKKIISIALMLNCKINNKTIWQRKHYDWPDLPKGYQDTASGAYSIPIGVNGEFLGIRITECHIEEDPAKWDPSTGEIDYNRCGVPLVEIVTEPDFKDSKQASNWLKQLLIVLSYIKAIDKDSGIKADVNVSTGGERVEIKNINSVYNIERAVDYEILRQTELKKQNKEVERETRAFSEKTKSTISMRSKEQAEDYRYIPDPDLPLIEISKEFIEDIRKKLPESHLDKIKRFVKEYNLTEYDSKVLSSNLVLAEFFEKIIEKNRKMAKLAASWVTIELLRVLNYNKKELDEVEIRPEHFSKLLELINEKKVTELSAKQILNKFIPKSFPPSKELKKAGIIVDKKELEHICLNVLKKNIKAVEDYKSGQEKALFFLVGQVMAETQRRADSQAVKEILIRLLKIS